MNTVLNNLVILLFIASNFSCTAQKKQGTVSKNYMDLNWKEVATKMPDEWYGSSESKMVADSVLKYQTAIGGWPKNNSFHKGMNQEEWARIQSSGVGATFDNGATLTEMMFLTKMYAKTNDERYSKAFQKGFDYILKAQYANGGWPQFYPVRKGGAAYSSQITYNDNAMVNIMRFLTDFLNGNSFDAAFPISIDTKMAAQAAFNKGLSCILKTQIMADGKPTVWCAQHDEVTLQPAKARAYELPSFSGQESAGITLLLMDIPDPSADIKKAVKGAVTWFENHKIEGFRVQDTLNSKGQKDRVVVEDKNAPLLWARFYDLETGEPFFCDRDGVKLKTIAELGHERRNGYSWYTNAPAKVLTNYPGWAKKWGISY